MTVLEYIKESDESQIADLIVYAVLLNLTAFLDERKREPKVFDYLELALKTGSTPSDNAVWQKLKKGVLDWLQSEASVCEGDS